MEALITLGISIIFVELSVLGLLWNIKRKNTVHPVPPAQAQQTNSSPKDTTPRSYLYERMNNRTAQQSAPSISKVAPQNVPPVTPTTPTQTVRAWRPTDEENYYDVLGISITASEIEIKAAYKSLLKIWHPDISTEPDAQEQMSYIIEAYEVLSEKDTREKYNAGLEMQELAYQGV